MKMGVTMRKTTKRSTSLRTKLIIICLLLLAIPSLIIGGVGYQMSKIQLDQSGKVQLKNDVRLVIGMIDMMSQEVKAGHIKLEDAQEKVKEEILGKKDASGKRPINKRFDLGKNGYFIVLDKQGKELAHPTVEGQNVYNMMTPDGKPVGKTMIDAAINGGDFVYFEWALPNDPNKSDKKILYSELDPNWDWVVVAGSYMADYNSGANQILYLLLVTLGISLLLGAFVAWYFATRLTKPIIKIAQNMYEVSQGNLKVEEVEVKSRDEVGKLAASYNKMIEQLKTLIQQARISAEQVAASSEQLTASAEQTSGATEHVATTIQDITTGAEKQARSVEEIARSISQMSMGVQKIAASSQTVSSTSIQASEVAANGYQSIQTAIKQMNSINQTVNKIAGVVKGLGERSQEIGNIIDAITSIASQTNLLALNAAIEAARAGEHGRGFAVVADEVRKLAEQSAESAQQIASLIATIQEETKLAVKSMEEGTKEVAEGLRVVDAAGTSFENIQHSVMDVSTQTQEVSAEVQQLSAGSEKVVQSIEEISEIAESTAEHTQTVSAAAEEQLASMEEVTSSAAALSSMAEELQRVVNKFRL